MDQKSGGATPSPTAKPLGWSTRVFWGLVLLAAGAAIRMAATPHTQTPQALATPVGAAAPPLPPGVIGQTEGVLFDWKQDAQPGDTTYAVSGLLLNLSAQPGDPPQPILRITGPGSETIVVNGGAGLSSAQARLGVGRIDPGSPSPQVIFTSYSGGAHCCTSVVLIERLGGVWKETPVASIDGDGIAEFPKDIAGDGEREFQFYDNAFLYTFASYAQSYAPPTLTTVRNGVVTDVSAQPRFHKIFEAYVDKPKVDCITNHNNGACAAYVAAAARLGKTDEAWPIMLRSYDSGSTWSLPTACRSTTAPCPAGQTVTFATFPEALLWFLGAQGYIPKPYLEPADATGPSFPCEGVSAPVLKLICALPELSQADRTGAELFGRVLALSADPATTRAAERDFVLARDAAPADAFTLLRLYQAHAIALQAALAERGT